MVLGTDTEEVAGNRLRVAPDGLAWFVGAGLGFPLVAVGLMFLEWVYVLNLPPLSSAIFSRPGPVSALLQNGVAALPSLFVFLALGALSKHLGAPASLRWLGLFWLGAFVFLGSRMGFFLPGGGTPRSQDLLTGGLILSLPALFAAAGWWTGLHTWKRRPSSAA